MYPSTILSFKLRRPLILKPAKFAKLVIIWTLLLLQMLIYFFFNFHSIFHMVCEHQIFIFLWLRFVLFADHSTHTTHAHAHSKHILILGHPRNLYSVADFHGLIFGNLILIKLKLNFSLGFVVGSEFSTNAF